MGSVLAQKAIEQDCYKVTVITKSSQKRAGEVWQSKALKHTNDLKRLPKNYHADIVFLAIKPQEAQDVLSKFYDESSSLKIFSNKTIFISILAGKEIKFFEGIFGKSAKILRSMPNLPIANGNGIFAYMANKNFSTSDLKVVENLFSNYGKTVILKNEKLFDVITAIFGSGPAYVFLLQEILTKIAIGYKINKDEALELVQQLLLGSDIMSLANDKQPQQLRQEVTSKGGTTEAALAVLQKNDALENLFKKAIAAAITKAGGLK